jgi:hypothetical protein
VIARPRQPPSRMASSCSRSSDAIVLLPTTPPAGLNGVQFAAVDPLRQSNF